jgi:hypothetical protein
MADFSSIQRGKKKISCSSVGTQFQLLFLVRLWFLKSPHLLRVKPAARDRPLGLPSRYQPQSPLLTYLHIVILRSSLSIFLLHLLVLLQIFLSIVHSLLHENPSAYLIRSSGRGEVTRLSWRGNKTDWCLMAATHVQVCLTGGLSNKKLERVWRT